MNRLNRHFLRSLKRWPNRFMAGLLRLLFVSARFSRAGFVLPTAILLLLIVSLTVGALSFRSFSRATNAISQREQQVVYGAAAPAIERAKSKLEYLFDKKVPQNSTPNSDTLSEYLLDGGSGAPFTLPDETRVDINGDGNVDNAWTFNADINGDGTEDADEKIVYSILVDHEAGSPTKTISDLVDRDKAEALVTRNGPVDVTASGNNCPVSLGTNEEGWQELSVGNSTIKKNFQIDAFAVNASQVNRTVSAIEVQQVRESRKGSKWGAWFRYDLEAFPGEDFSWNGAMHTEGSLFFSATDDFNLRMISSQKSCLYSDSASDIELVDLRDTDNNFDNGLEATTAYAGQLVAGGLSTGFGGSSSKTFFDYDPNYDGSTAPATTPASGTNSLGTGGDSIATEPTNIADIALDPIKIFTADESDFRTWDIANTVANFWTTRTYATGDNRLKRTSDSEPPFVDDTFRADDRFGPKSVYDKSEDYNLDDAEAKIGESISANTNLGDTQKDSLIDPVDGLDGYWERQATAKGAKIIVGERLELGNPFGWKGAYASTINPDNAANTGNDDKQINMDSLYPPFSNTADTGGSALNSDLNSRTNPALYLQRRSLNDNLAAVQSMAVYHYKNSTPNYPRACMSLVAHPGTPATIINARTFNTLPKNNAGTLSTTTGNNLVDVDGDATKDTLLDTDFFFGYGTNAWEYAPPLGTETAFETAYDTSTSALKKALTNLAYFAGDPSGGAPSFTPVQGQSGSTTDPYVHPYPTLSMWGDFSPLRRILEPTSNGGLGDPDYGDLSIADKATVHTAACTLGMLARNIRVAEQLNYADADVQAALTALATAVGNVSETPALGSNDMVPAAYISDFERDGDEKELALARLLHLKEQIKRDRTYGFLTTPGAGGTNTYPRIYTYTLSYGSQTIASGQTLTGSITLGFDPTVSDNNYFGFGLPSDAATELRFLRLAAVAGGLQTGSTVVGRPEFPSLYYLFPIVDHDLAGEDISNAGADDTDNNQPIGADGEPYVDYNLDGDLTNDYLYTTNDGASPYLYQALTATNLDTLALAPRSSFSDWSVIPNSDTTTGRPNLITVDGTDKAIMLQDKAFMDGREMLSIRAVEIDVDMATDYDDATVNDKQVGSQSWFTEGEVASSTTPSVQGGIFYAFREDARREDEIVRPIASGFTDAEAAWTDCSSTANIIGTDCRMNYDVGAEQDPPIRRSATAGDDNYISPKPVDFYPDVERRPYGFRLSNGKTLNRADTVATGLTFVTDNALYVKGDFNWHTARQADSTATPPVAVGDNLEEFFTPVDLNGDDAITKNEFYFNPPSTGRGATTTDYNTNLFAKPDGDDWRPVELVADAVNILSSNFIDGNATNYFLTARATTKGGATSSYQNMPRVREPGKYASNATGNKFRYSAANRFKVFQTPYASDLTGTTVPSADPIWPFLIRRNGEIRGASNSAPYIHTGFPERQQDQIGAASTRVNALMISGIIPSRAKQSYGGLHNFPRLNEFWLDSAGTVSTPLYISGGFYQLNFSTASTGLFEHDTITGGASGVGAWESGETPNDTAGFATFYYGAPKRIWGYDVALQYVTPGPVSQRFAGSVNTRSEYYQELAANDPYIVNLQCAKDEAGDFVITNKTIPDTDCP